MIRSNKKVIGGILLIVIVLVAVGYAEITNIELKISGTGNAQANKDNFIVEFIGTPMTEGKGTTQATIDTKDSTQGNMTVSGLTAKGDIATATYTLKNKSADISADLTAKATSSNEEYFETICTVEKTTLKAQEETTLTVTVKLLKTPIDETKEDLKSNIGVSIIAEPKQPGEELNGGSTTVTSKKTTKPYLPDGFTQVEGTKQEDLKKDSTILGNYNNNLWKITNKNLKYISNGYGWTNTTEKIKNSSSSILLSTGASDTFSKQGIYDLAGNV